MKNKMIKLVTMMVLIFGLTGLAQAGAPTSDDCPGVTENGETSYDAQCCVVDNSENPEGESEELGDYPNSLEMAHMYFHAGTSSRKCRDRISFTDKASRVHIYKNYTFDLNDPSHEEFHLGNTDGSQVIFVIHDTVANDMPAITIKDIPHVTIENLAIEIAEGEYDDVTQGFRGTFIKVENSHFLTIKNIRINNKPYKPAIEISQSTDVTIEKVMVESTSIDPSLSAEATAEELSPVIKVTDSNDFSFTNSVDYKFNEIVGHGIEISESGNFSIKNLELHYNDDEASTQAVGVSIVSPSNSTGTLSGITIDGINGTGIKFDNVADGSNIAVTGITMIANVANADSGAPTNDANGLVINNSSQLSFGDLEITKFGKNGVWITGTSSRNDIIGSGKLLDTENSVYIADNGTNATYQVPSTGGHGVLIDGTANENNISESALTHNLNCGLYLESTGTLNNARNNNYRDDDECGVSALDGGPVLIFDSADLTIMRRGDNTILFDYNYNSFLGLQLSGFELHAIRNSDEASSGSTSGLKFSSKTLVKKVLVKPSLSTRFSQNTETGNSGSTNGLTLEGTGSEASDANGNDISTNSTIASWIGDYSIGNLPDAAVPADPESIFFVLAYNTSGYMIGVANDLRAVSTTDLDDGCYTDPETSISYRMDDPYADQDGDGLFDKKEDIDGDCYPGDAGVTETSVYDTDTDDDGVDDYTEVKVTLTNPLNKDTDSDDLLDGQEDMNPNDGLLSGETYPTVADTDEDGCSDGSEIVNRTDPTNPDTDGDGLKDCAETELCPHIPSSEQCYYENCIPSDEFVSPDVITGGDDSSGENCVDSDKDDICDNLEDADGSCSPTTGEMIVGLEDTDGDGIKDGDEDYNHNGAYEPELSETNPVEEDSDGDHIPDGLEDVNGNHFVDDTSETSPILADTDGDGISDGEEDYNYNGEVNEGETDPALQDTDGDGLIDSTSDMDFTDPSVTDVYDIAPWEYGPENNYTVRYCGLNGWDTFDQDGDGLPDAVEDVDGDCLTNDVEPSPLDVDSDDDGVTDFEEVECGYGGDGLGTNPRSPDSDGDGMTDAEESENTRAAGICGSLHLELGDTPGSSTNLSGCGNSLIPTNDATSGSGLPIMMLAGVVMILVVKRMRYFA